VFSMAAVSFAMANVACFECLEKCQSIKSDVARNQCMLRCTGSTVCR
jgi:hypothetical protein